jgi:hypothetical protein
MLCPKCGKPNNQALTNCIYCSVNLHTGEESAASLETALIGDEAAYYEQKFQMMRQFNTTTAWNFAAFFCGTFWFVYRKMYKWALLTVVAGMINIIIPFFPGLLVSVMIGVFGNSIYMRHIEKLAAQYNALPENEKPSLLKRGGTSGAAVGVAIALYILLIIAIAVTIL